MSLGGRTMLDWLKVKIFKNHPVQLLRLVSFETVMATGGRVVSD